MYATPKSDVCERNIHDFEKLTYVVSKSDACTDVSPKIVQKSGSEQNVMPLRIRTKTDALDAKTLLYSVPKYIAGGELWIFF